MQRYFRLIIFCIAIFVTQGCTVAPPTASSPAVQPSATIQPSATTLPPTTVPASAPTSIPPTPTTLSVATSQAPQTASYQMDVQLDPTAKTVVGSERITYRNPSQDTLSDVWLHLYLKAFSSSDTLWMRESGGGSRGFNADPSTRGDISVHTLALADGTDLLASATVTDTLMHVRLPQPLAPGKSIELNATWTSKLPRVFARTGYGGRDDTFFMVGQWYPKMAVYDRGQWDAEPWHTNAEFFHDFGSYDVRVTVPQEYVVAGVGVPAGEQAGADRNKTVRFTATDVTDFAFAASPDFRTSSTKAGDVDVVLFYLPEHSDAVTAYLDSAAGSLQTFSDWYGAYPHPRLTVIDVPDNAGGAGGMEYPTLVTGGTLGSDASRLAEVVSHEVGHQWWPMQTATNEAREPWLDEGITEYSGLRYMQVAGYISPDAELPGFLTGTLTMPATLPSWSYTPRTYGTAIYGKTTIGLWTLEGVVGSKRMHTALANYLSQYRFKHPTGTDFRRSLEQSLGSDADWFFDFMNGGGVVDYAADAIGKNGNASTAAVMRTGSIQVPVDVLITLRSGAQQTKTWTGEEPSIIYTFPLTDPVIRIDIDPSHKLKAELDRDNNSAGQ